MSVSGAHRLRTGFHPKYRDRDKETERLREIETERTCPTATKQEVTLSDQEAGAL